VSTTDFFFPLVDDPYTQGLIGAANVLSDVYSLGIDRADTTLMLVGSCTEICGDIRNTVTRLMMQGFADGMRQADCQVSGGQTILNPWPIIGGVATAVVHEDDFIPPSGLEVGDVLVLTKPLGTQPAVHRYNVARDRNEVSSLEEANEIIEDYQLAVRSMLHHNRTAARLMHKYRAHGATDITGYGILGHATNLAEAQRSSLRLQIHTLPCIAGTTKQSNVLLEGRSVETSGGLLIALANISIATSFLKELEELDRIRGWIVGCVRPVDSSLNSDESLTTGSTLICNQTLAELYSSDEDYTIARRVYGMKAHQHEVIDVQKEAASGFSNVIVVDVSAQDFFLDVSQNEEPHATMMQPAL